MMRVRVSGLLMAVLWFGVPVASPLPAFAAEPDSINCPCSIYASRDERVAGRLLLIVGATGRSGGPDLAFKHEHDHEIDSLFETVPDGNLFRLNLRGHPLETNPAGTRHCQSEVRFIGEDRATIREEGGLEFCLPLGLAGVFSFENWIESLNALDGVDDASPGSQEPLGDGPTLPGGEPASD